MGDTIPGSAALVIDFKGIFSPRLGPVFKNKRIPVQYYDNMFQLIANIAKVCSPAASVTVISMLSELAIEDFRPVTVIRNTSPQTSFLCLDDLCRYDDPHLGYTAAKLDLQIAPNPAKLESMIISLLASMPVKTRPVKADIPSMDVFERRMSKIADKFFLTTPPALAAEKFDA